MEGVGVLTSTILTSGMGCCSLLARVGMVRALGEGEPGRDRVGSAWARAMRSPSMISSFLAGLGDIKIDRDGLLVKLARLGAGVVSPVGVGGGGVGLPKPILEGSSTIWDPDYC
jgi:hypothetical protein